MMVAGKNPGEWHVTLGPLMYHLLEVPEGVEIRGAGGLGPMLSDARTMAAAKKWVCDDADRKIRRVQVSLHVWGLADWGETKVG